MVGELDVAVEVNYNTHKRTDQVGHVPRLQLWETGTVNESTKSTVNTHGRLEPEHNSSVASTDPSLQEHNGYWTCTPDPQDTEHGENVPRLHEHVIVVATLNVTCQHKSKRSN
jgi:hypothetical protein